MSPVRVVDGRHACVRRNPTPASFQERESRVALRSHNAYVTIVRLCPSNPAPHPRRGTGAERRTVRRNSGIERAEHDPRDERAASHPRTDCPRASGTRRASRARCAADVRDAAGSRHGSGARRGAACRGDHRLHFHVHEEPPPRQAERNRRRRPRSCRGSGCARRHVRELDAHAGGNSAPVPGLLGRRQGQRGDSNGRPRPG